MDRPHHAEVPAVQSRDLGEPVPFNERYDTRVRAAQRKIAILVHEFPDAGLIRSRQRLNHQCTFDDRCEQRLFGC
ncbi:hypothetical protein GCM10009682_22330 [Luedemannella flava]|uniref:Uncharacterized protein n=1 Tax=Luedemannella flava TaxID=349316 RepID=A0ABP4Y3D2_9ACTN